MRAQPPEPRTPLQTLAEELAHARSLLAEERKRNQLLQQLLAKREARYAQNRLLRAQLKRLDRRCSYFKNLCYGYEIELGVRPRERKSAQVEQEAA